MKAWIGTIRYYLRQFIELGLLLIGVSVFAEILFGPDVAFFGSQVTKNLVALLETLGDSGIAALAISRQVAKQIFEQNNLNLDDLEQTAKEIKGVASTQNEA